MSKPFLCALLGLTLTAIGLTDLVDWPLWPATLTLEHGFGIRDPFEDRSTREKAVILVSLITGNSIVWTLLACGAARLGVASANENAEHGSGRAKIRRAHPADSFGSLIATPSLLSHCVSEDNHAMPMRPYLLLPSEDPP